MILNSENFKGFIMRGTVLVDFTADWCGPCRTMKPILEKVTGSLQIPLGVVNVDKSEDIATHYGVSSLPTICLFRDGRLVKTTVGAMDEQRLRAWLA
jgi:thioredoxin